MSERGGVRSEERGVRSAEPQGIPRSLRSLGMTAVPSHSSLLTSHSSLVTPHFSPLTQPPEHDATQERRSQLQREPHPIPPSPYPPQQRGSEGAPKRGR